MYCEFCGLTVDGGRARCPNCRTVTARTYLRLSSALTWVATSAALFVFSWKVVPEIAAWNAGLGREMAPLTGGALQLSTVLVGFVWPFVAIAGIALRGMEALRGVDMTFPGARALRSGRTLSTVSVVTTIAWMIALLGYLFELLPVLHHVLDAPSTWRPHGR